VKLNKKHRDASARVYVIIDSLLGFGLNLGPAIFLLYIVGLAPASYSYRNSAGPYKPMKQFVHFFRRHGHAVLNPPASKEKRLPANHGNGAATVGRIVRAAGFI